MCLLIFIYLFIYLFVYFSCSFYVAFWSLSLYDLHVPKDRYNDEINKAKDVIQVLENNQEMVITIS